MGETSPIQVLLTDHVAARAEMDAVAANTIGLSAAGWPGVAAEVGGRCGALHQLLLLHFRREEDGLYPDIVRMVSEGASEVDIIAGFFREATDHDLVAHTTLRGRLLEIKELVAAMGQPERDANQVARELQATVASTRDLLNRHAEKEETVVFPMIARLLSEDQMEAVRARLAAIEAEG